MAEPKAKTTKTPKAAAPAVATSTKLHRRTMTGMVVSDKMMKTCVVSIERRVQNGAYGKFITKRNKFKVHDEKNTAKIGDLVTIIESRPLSRDKRWALQKILRKASGEVLVKG
ncbi:MAG: 30S ribosomal protein S17 [Bdellovibrionales bacterium]|nr:30S ribosomal protein S17 [Bdellovibrionales bacterium]